VYRDLVEKPEGKRRLGRHRHRWESKLLWILKEVGCWGMDWIELAQDRGSGGKLCDNEQPSSIKFWEFLD
jgi:hypothetical protein